MNACLAMRRFSIYEEINRLVLLVLFVHDFRFYSGNVVILFTTGYVAKYLENSELDSEISRWNNALIKQKPSWI